MDAFALLRHVIVRPGVGVALAAAAMLMTMPGLAVAATGVTERVSVTLDGNPAGPDRPFISTSGRYVAFAAAGSNLVAGDTNGRMDVFVRDRAAGTTERVSLGFDGTQANGDSVSASVSANGRYVAFSSFASNLVVGDTNGTTDVFVYDRTAGTTELVSVPSDGIQFLTSAAPSISADGRYVVFRAFRAFVRPDDATGGWGVFVRDRQAATTERVSVASDGTPGRGMVSGLSITPDGRHVAFSMQATNLVTDDTNAAYDVFVHDRLTQTTERVSVASDGTEANSASDDPVMSADGRYVAFESWASNLVPGDTNGTADVFVHDRQTDLTQRVSVASDGSQVPAETFNYRPVISADGRYVAFHSVVGSLVTGDTNARLDVFVRDRTAGTTERVSVAPGGTQINDHSYSPSISADGRFIAFLRGGHVFVLDRSPTLDSTPPSLTLPGAVNVEATSSAGSIVTYGAAASDDTDPAPEVECTPASGSRFALGDTTVSCTATDDSGNTKTGSFVVTVADTTTPQLSLPGEQTVDATGPAGATVTYAVGATDVADPTPVVECVPASGSTFGVGDTTVSCVATDDSGNTDTGSFTVTVKGAAQQLADLGGIIRSYGLPLAIEQTLLDKVTNAQRDLARGRTADAYKRLADLIKKVDQLDARNRLTDDQAAELRTDATRIQDALGF
jgi:Tol biopolymer transport system component